MEGFDAVEQVRRPSDEELCGHVDARDGVWRALTVFGVVLGSHAQRADAIRQVLDDGLASLAERWTLRDGVTGNEEVVCIMEANAQEVTVARGVYATPDVPRLTVSVAQLHAGEWELRR